MTKRSWLKFLLSILFGAKQNTSSFASEQLTSSSVQPGAPKNIDNFPFEIIKIEGAKALAEWERLKTIGRGIPIIVGSDEDLRGLIEAYQFEPSLIPSDVLDKAKKIELGFDIEKYRVQENLDAEAHMKSLGMKLDMEENPFPKIGKWPSQPEGLELPTIPYDGETGKPLEIVNIILVPAEAASDVPAYLHWGNWNSCPPPEVHIAMLRKWNQRYGAELVGLTRDVMNLRVVKRPESKDVALKLATEQYHYCADIVDQGTETLAPLAALLMASGWWYFWWD
jgi:Domain of unknown function (DUF4253)